MLVRNTGDTTGVALPDPVMATLPDGSTRLTFTITDQDVASFKDANGKVWTFYLVYKTQTEDLFAENAHQTFKNTATVVGFEKNEKSAETTTDLAKLVDKNFVYANPPFVEYTVKVNQAGLDLVEGKDTLTLVDTMGEAIAYLPGTAQYTLASGGASVPLSPSYDPVAHTLTFTVPDSTALTLTYKTKVTLKPGVSFGELGRNSIMPLYSISTRSLWCFAVRLRRYSRVKASLLSIVIMVTFCEANFLGSYSSSPSSHSKRSVFSSVENRGSSSVS